MTDSLFHIDHIRILLDVYLLVWVFYEACCAQPWILFRYFPLCCLSSLSSLLLLLLEDLLTFEACFVHPSSSSLLFIHLWFCCSFSCTDVDIFEWLYPVCCEMCVTTVTLKLYTSLYKQQAFWSVSLLSSSVELFPSTITVGWWSSECSWRFTQCFIINCLRLISVWRADKSSTTKSESLSLKHMQLLQSSVWCWIMSSTSVV